MREKIERAFGPYLMLCLFPVAKAITWGRKHHLDLDALAESEDVIAIEIEVEAWKGPHQERQFVTLVSKGGHGSITIPDYEGEVEEGPYLFIGLPLPPKKEE